MGFVPVGLLCGGICILRAVLGIVDLVLGSLRGWLAAVVDFGL